MSRKPRIASTLLVNKIKVLRISPVFNSPKFLAVEVFADRQNFAQQLQRRVVMQTGACPDAHHIFTTKRIKKAPNTYKIQLNSASIHPHQNHDGAQHDGPNDAGHQKDNDVVHGERLLNEIARQELKRPGIGELQRTCAVFNRFEPCPTTDSWNHDIS